MTEESTISFTEYISSEMPWLVSFVKFCFYGVFIFLGINQYQSAILLIFMAFDTALGMGKSRRLGQQLSWGILWGGLFAKLVILIIPMLFALLGKGLGFDFTILVDVVMKILILNEFISCITNILSIRTRVDIRNKDFISLLLRALRTRGTRIIESMLITISKKD